ncbi:hypothetical protein JFT91_03360 [Pseudomonas sp. TH08]|uniref:hypothetical protein n=1 Tax=unclassified Pseudomonas TaxID=196821 RepID=UPI001913F73C|nr:MULTISPECIES: hypothetical protein [unclassified Pseudomonas]MBK5527100.1 hypothetical protein [Pseudomonas sp. TH06]MBK5531645.1 hypothetical protein [Pseudomonas sp. TH08]
MNNPLGKFCNDDNSFCITLSHFVEQSGQIGGIWEEGGQSYPVTGTCSQRDNTYIDVRFTTQRAAVIDSWQGEIDSLQGSPTLSVIRTRVLQYGRHSLTGYYLKQKPPHPQAKPLQSSATKPLRTGLFLQFTRENIDAKSPL